MINQFELVSPFQPAGDQPEAIRQLTQGLESAKHYQTLLGVTGSGKTFTMANVIARMNRPALVLSHNKTLAAQLYAEFRGVLSRITPCGYFVSYYDYYQPEAYIPQRDIYIEKETSINNDLDRLRLAATSALVSRRDVVIVASVSCIYGLGSPSDYKAMMLPIHRGGTIERDELLYRLVDILYERNDIDFKRGTFRVRGDVVEVWPAYEEFAYRIEMFGDEVERLSIINPVSGEAVQRVDEIYIYPAKHFVLPEERIARGRRRHQAELERAPRQASKSKASCSKPSGWRPALGLTSRCCTEVGTCPGIENYSRYLSGPSARRAAVYACSISSRTITCCLSTNRT